jgi:hypothetical protein
MMNQELIFGGPGRRRLQHCARHTASTIAKMAGRRHPTSAYRGAEDRQNPCIATRSASGSGGMA